MRSTPPSVSAQPTSDLPSAVSVRSVTSVLPDSEQIGKCRNTREGNKSEMLPDSSIMSLMEAPPLYTRPTDIVQSPFSIQSHDNLISHSVSSPRVSQENVFREGSEQSFIISEFSDQGRDTQSSKSCMSWGDIQKKFTEEGASFVSNELGCMPEDWVRKEIPNASPKHEVAREKNSCHTRATQNICSPCGFEESTWNFSVGESGHGKTTEMPEIKPLPNGQQIRYRG